MSWTTCGLGTGGLFVEDVADVAVVDGGLPVVDVSPDQARAGLGLRFPLGHRAHAGHGRRLCLSPGPIGAGGDGRAARIDDHDARTASARTPSIPPGPA